MSDLPASVRVQFSIYLQIFECGLSKIHYCKVDYEHMHKNEVTEQGVKMIV